MHQTNLIITLIDPIGPSINPRQFHMARMVHIIWEIFNDVYLLRGQFGRFNLEQFL